jgi:cold shock CspA family protein
MRTGTVLYFNDELGFGCIVQHGQEEAPQDIFVWVKEVVDRSLLPGDNVQYRLAVDSSSQLVALQVIGGTGTLLYQVEGTEEQDILSVEPDLGRWRWNSADGRWWSAEVWAAAGRE